MLLALQGYTDGHIGERIHKSTRNVGGYLSAGYAALGVAGRPGLCDLRDATLGAAAGQRHAKR